MNPAHGMHLHLPDLLKGGVVSSHPGVVLLLCRSAMGWQLWRRSCCTLPLPQWALHLPTRWGRACRPAAGKIMQCEPHHRVNTFAERAPL